MSNSRVVGRVTIPSSVRKTIENIKEITAGNHSDEDIYSMLKECNMDPNDTAQKLLFQDTFHEVKRKRDRRRENVNKESAEPKWKPAVQGRGNKGSRGNFTSRHVSLDAGGGRNSALKENGAIQVSDKHINPPSVPIVEAKNTSSLSSASANGVVGVAFGSNGTANDAHASAGRAVKQSEATAGAKSVKLDGPLHAPSNDANKGPKVSLGTRDMLGQKMPNSTNSSTSFSSPPSSGAYFSASDPVLLCSHDSRPPGAVCRIRWAVVGQRVPFEHVPTNSNESKTITAVSDSRSSTVQVKISSKFQGSGKNQVPVSLQSASLAQGVSSLSRPASNHNDQPPLVGQQKAGPAPGPGKEWKPKPTNNNNAHGSATSAVGSSDVSTVSAEVNTQLQSQTVDVETKEGTLELQKKLEKTHISDIQHVIIPNHLHVPEAEKLGFCFGSFESSLGLGIGPNEAAEDEETPLSGTSEGVEEVANEQFSSVQNPSAAAENADCADQSPPSRGEENLSAKPENVPSSVTEYSESKQDTLQGGHQYSVVHTSPNYSFGFVPPTLGSQLAPFENSESQSRDVSRLPNFVVQQPIDPASYYVQFYRSSADVDGCISPFHSAGVSTNYNSNVAVVPPQTSQSAQEGGNPLILSTATPTPVAAQAAGLMQSSADATQQPLPVFRQAAGMHLPHYPPNYIPYAHYFSPYYVPPTAIHQFLSNSSFPQQPQAGGVYPPPSAAARYSLSQYRPGANVGNSTHIGVPGSYGSYGSSTANYNPSSTTAAGNPASNEDLSATQYNENVRVSVQQQSDGSDVWIPPGRDLSSLQASSFYNLPHGQLAFTPTQPGHGNLPGLYHPAQPVTAQSVRPHMHSQTMSGPIDMVGPTATVYQQPQHSQVNWPSSY